MSYTKWILLAICVVLVVWPLLARRSDKTK